MYEDSIREIEEELLERRVRLVCKRDSWLMRILNVVIFWNRRQWQYFTTTIVLGPIRAIYLANKYETREDGLRKLSLIRHELCHVIQADGPATIWLARWFHNVLHNWKYGFWWFVVRWATYRVDCEVDAYAIGLDSRITEGKEAGAWKQHHLDSWVERVAKALSGSAYLYSMPHDKVLEKLQAHPLVRRYRDTLPR